MKSDHSDNLNFVTDVIMIKLSHKKIQKGKDLQSYKFGRLLWRSPTRTMLLSVFAFFNIFLRKRLYEGRSIFDIDFEDFCSFINELSSQSCCYDHHSDKSRKKPKKIPCKLTKRKYSRYLITFYNGQIDVKTIEIPLMYCKDTNGYHALLPAFFIISKHQYSIQFILSVLIYWDNHKNDKTACSISTKFNIPRSTMYRWKKDYSRYLILYKKHLGESVFSCFIRAFSSNPDNLINIIYNILKERIFSLKYMIHYEYVTWISFG